MEYSNQQEEVKTLSSYKSQEDKELENLNDKQREVREIFNQRKGILRNERKMLTLHI